MANDLGFDPGIGEIPKFLIRDPNIHTRSTPKRRQKFRMTPIMKAAAARDSERRAKEAARWPVRDAIYAGADTLGKIRKVTGLETGHIRAALRVLCKRDVDRVLRRYYPRGRR